jgi:hypothetical protein
MKKHKTIKIVGWILAIFVGFAILLAIIAGITFSRLDQTNGVLESSGQERKYCRKADRTIQACQLRS